MPQSLFHAIIGFALPDFHIDMQGGNLHRANTAILPLHALYAGIGSLRDRGIAD